ncbi:MAG: Amylopullulanase AmyB [Thermoanaerobacterales bacterium 50_218]|nr:MAG: Amylopullulanase AmyB [Thermoanaerobacterales bacterium 50_218]
MGKLQSNRPLLGNIGLVVFLALLVTLTFGTVPQAQAFQPQVTPSPGSFNRVVTPEQPVAVEGEDGWAYNGQTAKVQATTDTEVSFTIQVCTPSDFNSILLEIIGVGNLDDGSKVSNAIYQVYGKVYGITYYAYQFIYTWVYENLNFDSNYTLAVYAGDDQPLASITLDLEAPPPRPSGGGGGGGGGAAPTEEETATGEITVEDGQGTLIVDADKVKELIADPEVEAIEFEIPADVAEEGTVELPADILLSVFEAAKPAVFVVGNVQLTVDPADLAVEDLQTLAEEGATLNVVVVKSEAPLPGYTALKVASDIYDIRIDVIGADGVRKGSIDSFNNPITITLPYDPDKLEGVSEDLLSIFRYNEETGQWDLVPGSRVDKENNTVSVESYHLSKYAVMAYEAAFTDIIGHWAEADIKLMAAKGIVKGMSATTFAPEAQVTRAQFATLLVKALNIREQAATGERFTDVAADAWYARTVETAAANGLIKGYPDGSFRPNAKITRQELAAMVANALKFRGRDAEALTAEEVNTILSTFADRNQISDWARAAAAVVVKNGIVKGRAVDEFAPLATAKRCEAVVMIKQMLSFLGEL